MFKLYFDMFSKYLRAALFSCHIYKWLEFLCVEILEDKTLRGCQFFNEFNVYTVYFN